MKAKCCFPFPFILYFSSGIQSHLWLQFLLWIYRKWKETIPVLDCVFCMLLRICCTLPRASGFCFCLDCSYTVYAFSIYFSLLSIFLLWKSIYPSPLYHLLAGFCIMPWSRHGIITNGTYTTSPGYLTTFCDWCLAFLCLFNPTQNEALFRNMVNSHSQYFLKFLACHS